MDYLGMEFDFEIKVKVAISMEKCITWAIEEFSEQIVGKASSPGADPLFLIRLEKEKEV